MIWTYESFKEKWKHLKMVCFSLYLLLYFGLSGIIWRFCFQTNLMNPALRSWKGLLAQGVHTHGAFSRENPWEVMPDLYFYRDLEEIEKQERPLLKRLWLRNIRINRLLQLPSSLLLMLRTQTSLKACRCPLCLFISSPLKIRVLAGEWSASPTAQAIEPVGTTIEWSSAVLS